MTALLLTMTTAVAQDVKTVTDSVKAGMKSGSVKDAYKTVTDAFKVKRAEADSLLGTWVYVEPAVYATKGNLLMKLAENATASQLEKLLEDYLKKCNITSENTSFTFNKNGTFERDIVERGKNVEWVIDRYTKTVKPMYLQFIAPSKRYADIIVPQGGHNKVAINVLLSGIRKMAKEKEQE